MEQRRFESNIHKKEYLNYWYHCDSNAEKCPLVLYIHGAGNRGTELAKMGRTKVLGQIDKGRIP